MEAIREYLIKVTAAAILCGIVNTLPGKKSAVSTVTKMLCGLFMTFCVISPLVHLDDLDFSEFDFGFTDEAEAVTANGERMAHSALSDIIIERAQAYILDKAASMDLALSVRVSVSTDDPPQPCEVWIQGTVSPYERQVLSSYISENLAISEEDQHWT